jgi:hypothetical protein
MAAGRSTTAKAAEDREAAKVRRQKIFVGCGGVLLLGVVAFQLPGLLGGSGSGSPTATPAAEAAPLATALAPLPASVGGVAIPFWVRRLPPRDLFVPQVTVPGAAATSSSSGSTVVIPKGPAVRAKHFVVKDPFAPQISLPTAPAATQVSGPTPPAPAPSVAPAPSGTAGGSYIVVLATISGRGAPSRRLAAHAVVAARNAGLTKVVANDTIPGGTFEGPHFTVFTGPYTSAAQAHSELVRALRNGYPTAKSEHLSASSTQGF